MLRIDASHHFAIPLFSLQLTGDEAAAERAALYARLRALRETTPGKTVMNRASWHSTPDLHHDPDPAVQRFIEQTKTFVNTALAATYNQWAVVMPVLVETWAVLGGKGASHLPHSHAPTRWSGVFYVSAESCFSAPDPRGGKIEFANPIPGAASFGGPSSILVEPRDGLFLLFPGMLLHWVHPNPTDVERAVIGFNVMIEPKIDRATGRRSTPQ